MYLDFLFIPLGYYSLITKREAWFEVIIPLCIAVIGLCCSVFFNPEGLYTFIEGVIQFIETLLGFTLAALTLLLSNSNIEEKTKSFKTNRKKRNKKVSMYELLIIQFSHLIIIEAILCVAYYLAALFPMFNWEIGGMIVNTLFIFMTFHIMFATIRAVSCIYLIASGSR